MIPCSVDKNSMGDLTITFSNKRSIYLQVDYEIASFGVHCGIINAPRDWDGCPSGLSEGWYNADFEDITECPEDYEEIAE